MGFNRFGLKRVCWGAVAAASLAVPAWSETTLTYTSYLPNVYAVTKGDEWFMSEVEKRSNGEIKFERYWAGSLIKSGPDTLNGVGGGAADIAGTCSGCYNKNEVPLHSVTLPFITENLVAATRAMNDLYKSNEHVRKEFEQKGVKVLYIRTFPNNTAWTSAPLETVEDFKGKKMRAVNLIADALQSLGGVPVAVQWSEAVEGLERGVVDGMTSVPFDSAVPAGLHEIAKYASDAGRMGIYGSWTFVMNQARFDSLSPEHQQLIEQVAAEAADHGIELYNQINEESAKTMCETETLTVNIFSEEEAAKAKEIAYPAIEAHFVDWAGTASGTDAKVILDQYVDLVRKYEAEVEYRSGFDRYAEICGNS